MKYLFSAAENNIHGVFSDKNIPQMTIQSGDTVSFEILEADWRIEDNNFLSSKEGIFAPYRTHLDKGHAMSGPIRIDDAHENQTLALTILKIVPDTWGWSRVGGSDNDHLREINFEGEELFLRWKIDRRKKMCFSNKGHSVKLRPFLGNIAVMPKESELSTLTPGMHGGNIDCKDLVEGSTLFLPIFRDGGLFYIGDGHAAQGDGEVGGTAIECPITVAEVKFDVINESIDYPYAITQKGVVSFGFNEDLNIAAYLALNNMVKLLQKKNVSKNEALAVCSLALDLKVTQIVNGIKGVHAILDSNRFGFDIM